MSDCPGNVDPIMMNGNRNTIERGRVQKRCSFCKKRQFEARMFIAGPNNIFICDQCVERCQGIIGQAAQASKPSPEAQRNPNVPSTKPQDIYEHLQQYVVGQERAKKVLSVGVYNHYKRLIARYGSVTTASKNDDIELEKTNIMLVGPPGCGKTYLAQMLAQTLQVPFAIADATAVTEAGWVGEDVENILQRLIQAAGQDVEKAERGIVYIDEIDKIARKQPNPTVNRDASGEGVQQALLKILEGNIVNVPRNAGSKHPFQEFVQINTENILFILGGAFDGIDDIIRKRLRDERDGVGFGFNKSAPSDETPVVSPRFSANARDLTDVTPEDLRNYGFIPEFIGRIPVVVGLSDLTLDQLVKVLVEPKNSVVSQYQKLLGLDDVELSFEEEALEAIAQHAQSRRTGARGLRAIVEDILLDTMYSLPSHPDANKVVVKQEHVIEHVSPEIVDANGELVDFSVSSNGDDDVQQSQPNIAA